MVNQNWTPVDSFVTEYGFRHNKTFEYQPGSGEATMKTGIGMDLDDLKALIKSIEHHELQINVDGTILVYHPEEPGEEAEVPQEEPEIEAPVEEPPVEDEIAEAIVPEEEPPEEIIVEEEKPVEELIPA